MPSGPWSPTDVARAVTMRTDGATADAIAAALGRSAAAVSLRLHRARAEGHAVPLDRVLVPWTPERAERAVAMWCAGAHVDDIARELGTTPKAARAYVERAARERPYMERPPKPPKPPRPPSARAWTPERVVTLTTLWNSGATLEDMIARTGRTALAIKLLAVRLRRGGVALTDRRRRSPPVATPAAPVDAPA